MKSYVGGDEKLEAIQRERGFKTYREHFTRKINEAENTSKALKDEQKDIKVIRWWKPHSHLSLDFHPRKNSILV